MRPMFSYMGSKWRASKHYGPPKYPIVVEPFAGSACYSLYYNVAKAILCDINPRIVGIWDYLIKASCAEILALPVDFDCVDNLDIPQEARWLIGFWINKGNVEPCKQRSQWAIKYRYSGDCKVWGEAARSRIAAQVDKIREWKIYQKDYREIENIKATWFIDPPYTLAGRHYTFSDIDYTTLARFCQSRAGQVIVCENEGASWLPFKSIGNIRGTFGASRSGISKEVVYIQ